MGRGRDRHVGVVRARRRARGAAARSPRCGAGRGDRPASRGGGGPALGEVGVLPGAARHGPHHPGGDRPRRSGSPVAGGPAAVCPRRRLHPSVAPRGRPARRLRSGSAPVGGDRGGGRPGTARALPARPRTDVGAAGGGRGAGRGDQGSAEQRADTRPGVGVLGHSALGQPDAHRADRRPRPRLPSRGGPERIRSAHVDHSADAGGRWGRPGVQRSRHGHHGRPVMAGVTTVAAIDNDRMLLDGLRQWLDAVPEVRLVAAVTTVDAFFQLAPPTGAVDLVLLDLLLSDQSLPLDNLTRLVDADHCVLVVSVCSTPARIAATLAAGARGYLTKDNDLTDLVTAIHEVATYGTSYSPELAVACLRDSRPDRPTLSPADRDVLSAIGSGMRLDAAAHYLQLTPDAVRARLSQITATYHRAGTRYPSALATLSIREREVALLIRDGMTNAQIARRLGVTTKTVEKHASSTMAKLGVTSRAGVAVQVGQDGWTP